MESSKVGFWRIVRERGIEPLKKFEQEVRFSSKAQRGMLESMRVSQAFEQSRGGSVRRGGEAAASFSDGFTVAFNSGWLMWRGNHARTAFGAWACRRRGGFGVFFGIFFRPGLLVTVSYGLVCGYWLVVANPDTPCVWFASETELAEIGVVYAEVVQTCTTSSRVVESSELVLSRDLLKSLPFLKHLLLDCFAIRSVFCGLESIVVLLLAGGFS
ncbi:hypothetical protein Taro_054577 [Colocasia esculenta]|uniref:Uncharacterized protein n=1 Tax=Colocasia esculenta TaxID=4460 RepID=A0A843XRL8_COLES|nr:hypothetical protein [Colocasia esculenta]